jgi:hypothetical protein
VIRDVVGADCIEMVLCVGRLIIIRGPHSCDIWREG